MSANNGGTALVLDDVARERDRQIVKKGYTFEHDDKHVQGEIAQAAIAYAQASLREELNLDDDDLQVFWPWEDPRFEPDDDRRGNLIKAIALLVAEVERLDRAQP